MGCNPWRWLWGLIPIAMLTWLAFTWEREGIETDLTSRAEQALEAQGYNWGQVSIDGRDAVLTGLSPDETQPYRATETVRDTWGVRVVRSRTDLASRDIRPNAVPVEDAPKSTVDADVAVPDGGLDRAELERRWRLAEEHERRWRSEGTAGRNKADADAQRARAAEEARRQDEAEEEAAKAAEAERLKEEDETKAAEEAKAAEAQEAERLKAAEERRAADERAAREEEEAKAAEAARLKAQEEAKAAEAEAARAAEEEARRKEDEREQAEADAEAQRLADEEAKRAEEDAAAAEAKRQQEAEAKRKADAEAAAKQAAEDAERRRKEEVELAARTEQDAVVAKKKAEADRCQGLMRSAMAEGVITFARAKADLTRDSYQTLDRLAGIVKACPEARINIAGHTDSEGLEERNQGLSERRATAVATYLESKGVEASRLSTVGYGESKPIAPNDTPEGMLQNRRIEFNVTPAQ